MTILLVSNRSDIFEVISKAMITEIARWGDERGALYDYDHWKEECNDVREDLIGRAEKYMAHEHLNIKEP